MKTIIETKEIRMEINKDDRIILLFDGICNFCDATVNFVLDHNDKKNILFAALQSKTGQDLLVRFGLPTTNFESLVVVEGDKVYQKSEAALRVARELNWPYNWLGAFGVVPESFRDFVYTWVAHNRYRFWGTKNACRFPDAETKTRFLD
jgi:predicted DCC family thiol-disulfide oxidoreductase YuxK